MTEGRYQICKNSTTETRQIPNFMHMPLGLGSFFFFLTNKECPKT